MKRYLLVTAILLGLTSCVDNTEEANKVVEGKDDLLSTDMVNNPHSAEGVDTVKMNELPTMDFKDTVHNFGNMHDGEVSTYDFIFENNGQSPLIISSAKGSCGCTVPDYPRKPVAPGETGVMNVQFDSKDKHGHVEKSVTITTNSKRGVHMLYIKADVQSN